MLLFNKYLNLIRRPSRPAASAKGGGGATRGEAEEDKAEDSMFSPCIREVTEACVSGCFMAPIFSSMADSRNAKLSNAGSSTTTTTMRTSRSNFVKATTTSLFPNTQFTNHESLPALPDAFASFVSVYPQFAETQQADRIRRDEYYHLSEHVCLDYAGISLFSHAQMQASTASTSTAPPAADSTAPQPPFFSISYKSASLVSQAQHQSQDTPLERAITARILRFLSVSDEEYSMVCTANRTTAFKLLAESYPFHTNKSLLSVYDYESEAVDAMAESAQKRGAKVMSASFAWPSMRIHSSKLTKKLSKSSNKRRRGLFVFPLLSRMTGSRYPYLWMSVAKEYGWHVVLDACALGAKDLDTFGLSLIKPDFIICSFFKVLGDNPAGFAGLLIKKSSLKLLETSNVVRSIGIVSIVPTVSLSQLSEDYSTTELDGQQSRNQLAEGADAMSPQAYSISATGTSNAYSGSTSNHKQKQEEEPSSEIVELEFDNSAAEERTVTSAAAGVDERVEIECRGLEHADSLGLLLISSRLRYITNWLVLALTRLRHPHSGSGHSLVKIYGPRVKFDRGHALAFNVFDWKGEKVEPALVQKLADRSSISLSCGFLKSILFSDKYEDEKVKVLEKRVAEATVAGSKRKQATELGIHVVNASFGFLTNFEDAYRLWAFVARFLDADFVEKERWRYLALNQKMVEV